MTLPICLTHNCPNLAMGPQARYVEAIIAGSYASSDGRRVWIERRMLNVLVDRFGARAVVLREADEVGE